MSEPGAANTEDLIAPFDRQDEASRDKWLGSLRSIFLFCGGDISKLPPEQTPEAEDCSA